MVEYKSTNAMNNMLPSVKSAHEEAAAIKERADEQRKRQRTELMNGGLKKFQDAQKA